MRFLPNLKSKIQNLKLFVPKVGQVKLMRWSGFHFLESPDQDMEIIRVEVLQPAGRQSILDFRF